MKRDSIQVKPKKLENFDAVQSPSTESSENGRGIVAPHNTPELKGKDDKVLLAAIEDLDLNKLMMPPKNLMMPSKNDSQNKKRPAKNQLNPGRIRGHSF